jgi:hypothetical protein
MLSYLAVLLGLAAGPCAIAAAQNTQWHSLPVKIYGGWFGPVVSTSRIDSCLQTASDILLDDSDGSDGTDDASCNSSLLRDGDVGTFFEGDANIDNGVDLDVVLNVSGFIKIVTSITYCNDTFGAIAGCTIQNGKNGMVLSEAALRSDACGKFIAHEFGHSVGFGHTGYNLNVMKPGEDPTLTHVFANQCPFFRSDCIDYDGPAGEEPETGCVTPVLEVVPEMSDLTGVSIETLVQQGLGDRVPIEASDFYVQDDAVRLMIIVEEPARATEHAAALRLLGLVGDDLAANAEVLMRYAESGFGSAASVSAAMISLGYLANRGSDAALEYVADKAERAEPPLVDWAVNALAVSGRDQARTHLQALSTRTHSALYSAPESESTRTRVDEALAAHARVRNLGLRAYYRGN